jgi:hypothetical protein
MQCDHGQVFLFFLSNADDPCGVCRRAYHPVWFVLCLLCCAVPTLYHCTHFGPLCSLCAVLNTCVLYVCVCLCVGPEVVDGKGRRPVETQNGGMVMYGNTW